MREYQSLNLTKWNCKYHLVCIYRYARIINYLDYQKIKKCPCIATSKLQIYPLQLMIQNTVFGFMTCKSTYEH